MNIGELKSSLEYFFTNDVGIIVYFVIKKGDDITVKMADIDNDVALPDLKKYFLDEIRLTILNNEELNIMRISQADERKNVIYNYDLDEVPGDLNLISKILQNQVQPTYNFKSDKFEDIKSYIILIGDSEHRLVLYKQHYGVFVIKRDSFLFHKENERFVRFNDDILRLDNSFQFFSINETLFIKDLDKLEKFFGFHDVIKKEALISIDELEKSLLLEDVAVLRESVDNVTFARKLTKLSINSPVLGKIPNDVIIHFTKTHPALVGKLKYNEDETKIRLDTKVSQELFVQLLGDSFLRSDLTNMYYASKAKDRIEQEQ